MTDPCLFCFSLTTNYQTVAAPLGQAALKDYLLFIDSEPVLPEDWKKWWDLVTIDPKDVIESIKVINGTTEDEDIFNYNSRFPSKFKAAEIKNFDSHQGKCISVNVNLKFTVPS